MIISIDDPDGLAVLEALPADVKSHTVAYGTTARESLPDLAVPRMSGSLRKARPQAAASNSSPCICRPR